MKVDSEEQRQTLMQLIGSVRVTVSMRDIDAQRNEFISLMTALRDAELEPKPKPIVPIEFLAPDTPNRIRSYEGMPEQNRGE